MNSTFLESVLAEWQSKKGAKKGYSEWASIELLGEAKLVFCRAVMSKSDSLYFVVFFLLFLVRISAGGVRV